MFFNQDPWLAMLDNQDPWLELRSRSLLKLVNKSALPVRRTTAGMLERVSKNCPIVPT